MMQTPLWREFPVSDDPSPPLEPPPQKNRENYCTHDLNRRKMPLRFSRMRESHDDDGRLMKTAQK
ncbi:MAG: hypothetical protein LBK55_09360, partial [Azoarcus sp.]|nr:hypothetical protein [Azoarcus sp.]